MTPPRAGYVRWVVCALLFFATTVNYIDRNVLGVLAPELQKQIGWSKEQYGDINATFSFAYAIGFLFSLIAIHLLSPRLDPVQVDVA